MSMGQNRGKYTGKYSGKAGKNYGRNPQPGWSGPGGGGGGGNKKGCRLFVLAALALPTLTAIAGAAWATAELL